MPITLEKALAKGETDIARSTLEQSYQIAKLSEKLHGVYKKYIITGDKYDLLFIQKSIENAPPLSQINFPRQPNVLGAFLIEVIGMYHRLGIINYNKEEICRELYLYDCYPFFKAAEPFYTLHLKATLNQNIVGADILPAIVKMLKIPWLRPNCRNYESNREYEEITCSKLFSYLDWAELKLDVWLKKKSMKNVISSMCFKVTLPMDENYMESKGCEFIEEAIESLSVSWSNKMQQERWKSENELYELIKKEFKSHAVIRHASPLWLGKQHLDIYIEELKLAIEYQGQQHYMPISVFGGKDGYDATLKRDRLKEKLCKDSGIKLEYVRYDDHVKKRVEEISELYNSKSESSHLS